MEPDLYRQFYEVERDHWWSVGMRGIFHMCLEEGLRGTERPRLLDLGCGTGIALEEFARHGRILGLDIAPEALEFTRSRNPGTPLVRGDLVLLPVAGESLDGVLALDVIEHLQDDAAAVREIHRILKPGGVALLNVPAFPSLWSGKDTANRHLRRYTRSTLRPVLEESGLRVERMTYTNAALFPAIWLARQGQRLLGRPWNSRSEYHPRPWVNSGLRSILALERGLLRLSNMPFGTSVTCLARRPS